MSFSTSETYIYAYIIFASVYLIASVAFVTSALRVSTALSRARRREAGAPAPTLDAAERDITPVTEVVGRSKRLIDYTQLSTILPLVYIVGSLFMGSLILQNTALVRTVNVAWIAFTAACTLASVLLALLGARETSAIGPSREFEEGLSGRVPEILQRIGLRLGVSAALLMLVAVFTLLNLWSILTSIDTLLQVDFLL